MFRKIYMVEAYDWSGKCRVRRYARNIKTARKIQKQAGGYEFASIRLMEDWEHALIDPDWVEV